MIRGVVDRPALEAPMPARKRRLKLRSRAFRAGGVFLVSCWLLADPGFPAWSCWHQRWHGACPLACSLGRGRPAPQLTPSPGALRPQRRYGRRASLVEPSARAGGDAQAAPCPGMRAAESKLLSLVVQELVRDGGTCTAAQLCQDYGTRISKLLGSAGRKKFVPFVMDFPDIFSTTCEGSICVVQLCDGWETFVEFEELPANDPTIIVAAGRLDSACRRALVRRAAKWQRRQERRAASNGDLFALQPLHTGALLRLVAKDVHQLVRLLPEHRPVCEPLSEGWYASVLGFLREFLWRRADTYVLTSSAAGNCSVDLAANASTGAPSLLPFSKGELKAIAVHITRVLHSSGLDMPGAAGVNLGRLCSDESIEAALQGRSLANALAYPTLHRLFETEADDLRGGALYVRMRPSPAGNITLRGEVSGEFWTDPVGLFSTVSGRPAKAMARILARAFESHPAHGGSAEDATVCDMTAGVGGNTRFLARFFGRVRAFEIDPVRAELLRKNVEGFQRADRVTCVEGDSLAALLGPECEDGCYAAAGESITAGALKGGSDAMARPEWPLPVAMIDPPWGGIHYKQHVKDAVARMDPSSGLSFGGLPLADVVAKLAGRFSVIGLKLPLAFNITSFVSSFETGVLIGHGCRKLGAQQFLCLQLLSRRKMTGLRTR